MMGGWPPSRAIQRVSVIVADAALVFGVSAWSRRDRKHHNGKPSACFQLRQDKTKGGGGEVKLSLSLSFF